MVGLTMILWVLLFQFSFSSFCSLGELSRPIHFFSFFLFFLIDKKQIYIDNKRTQEYTGREQKGTKTHTFLFFFIGPGLYISCVSCLYLLLVTVLYNCFGCLFEGQVCFLVLL